MKDGTLQLLKAASANAWRNPVMRARAKSAAGLPRVPDWIEVRRNEGESEATIRIYGVIDPFPWFDESSVSASSFAGELDELDVDRLHVRIESPGGSVFDGFAIYNLLKENRAEVIVHVDGIAASIASVIAMAGKEIIMGEASNMMIHRASSIMFGNAEDFRKEAEILEMLDDQIVDIYAGRTGQKTADLRGWLNEEKYMPAKEAVSLGFADRVAGGEQEETERRENGTAKGVKSNWEPQRRKDAKKGKVGESFEERLAALEAAMNGGGEEKERRLVYGRVRTEDGGVQESNRDLLDRGIDPWDGKPMSEERRRAYEEGRDAAWKSGEEDFEESRERLNEGVDGKKPLGLRKRQLAVLNMNTLQR